MSIGVAADSLTIRPTEIRFGLIADNVYNYMVYEKHQRKRKYELILCVFHSFTNHKRVYYYTTTITRRNFVAHHPTTYMILYKSQQVAEYLCRVTIYSIKYFISYTCE